jgi:hypothetical protein
MDPKQKPFDIGEIEHQPSETITIVIETVPQPVSVPPEDLINPFLVLTQGQGEVDGS